MGGSGDDTSLNAVCLTCSGGDQICSKSGPWGTWYGMRKESCTGGFDGFKLRFEASQGSGDDTAANNIHFRCKMEVSWVWRGTSVPSLGWLGGSLLLPHWLHHLWLKDQS